MIQLSNALYLAEYTRSKLTYCPHPFFAKRTFDFTQSENVAKRIRKSGSFFFLDQCRPFPLRYDFERRAILRKFVKPLLFPSFLPDPNVNENTLVLNIRSGDVFMEDYDSDDAIIFGVCNYTQPPLSFYQKIIVDHGYKDVLIVTQPDMRNPVIKGLLKWMPDIRLKEHLSPLEDFNTLLSARNLAIAHSTFSWCAALMSDYLQVLYQPASFQVRGVRDFEVHTYSFTNYIKPGTWKASEENMNFMLSFPKDNILEDVKPKLDVWTFEDVELSEAGTIRHSVPVNLRMKIFFNRILHRSSHFMNEKIPSFWLRIRILLRPRKRMHALLSFFRQTK